MDKTLQVLNGLVAEGVLSRYAIGGAMGATFYVEPVLTFDLDIFVVLPQTSAGLYTLAWISTEGNSPKDLLHRATNRRDISGEHS